MLPRLETQVVLAIALAALVTYSLRLGGLLLSARFPRTGRFRQGMNALPGSLLFALVFPSIVAEGTWGIVAAGLTAAVMLRSRNTLFAMLLGMAVVFAARRLTL
ncbi:branched-chain amino acid transport [Citrifermentans bremense]|uniref:Branched-chain amino acid transport n=1 Tax=Citrifermentans bremense TaxID=60035 RepID=A0A6S6M0Y8_9BACT|nr:AzlD domain-containing protein [Citrifermentans bremense]BCG47987.1 branched-chain amino acid transport [Citrifermentans bremense]